MSNISFEYNTSAFAGVPDEGTKSTHRGTPQHGALDQVTIKIDVQKVEELGFDAVWAPDHLLLGRDHAEYECRTLLSVTIGFTESINLGPLVLCSDYCSPAFVAKMTVTFDVISGGRLKLGLSAGWYEPEYNAHGWEYRDGFEHLMRLDESTRLVKRMWVAGTNGASFGEKHYQIENAYRVPGPAQDPHPLILIGGQGEEVTLKLVAKHADVWSTDVLNGDVEALERKIGITEDHCDTVDRDSDDIGHSQDGHVIYTRDEEKFGRLLDLMTSVQLEAEYQDQTPIVTEEDARGHLIIGTPEGCTEAIKRRIDAGVTKLQGWFVDFPNTDGMELFADEIIPQFS